MKLHFNRPDETTIERYVQQNTPLLAVTKGVLDVGIISGELIRCAGVQDGVHRSDALYFLTYDHAQYEYAELSGVLEGRLWQTGPVGEEAFSLEVMDTTPTTQTKELQRDPIYPFNLQGFDDIPVDD